MDRISARDAIRASTDGDSFRPWGGTSGSRAGAGTRVHRPSAGSDAGEGGIPTDEAVLVGEASVGGVRVAVLAWEFTFLGGSVGVAAATRIVSAVRRATAEELPLTALPRSGGTRMQEGAPAFVQMVAIAAALAEHRAAGLPCLVHLCGPTMGGVLATLGSAGDVTSAEPGARVGFLGPRAYAAITGEAFPEGVQTAENLLRLGIVDAVLPWAEVRERWATILGLWADRPKAGPMVGAAGPDAAEVVPLATESSPIVAEGGRKAAQSGPFVDEKEWHIFPRSAPAEPTDAPRDAADLWEYVELSRKPDRIDPAQFLAEHLTDIVVLPGTAQGDLAHGVTVALGRLAGTPVLVAATTDRRSAEALTVGGLRTIRRGIALAEHWGLPILTIVDTLGAQLSVEGEEFGIAGEIARMMHDLVAARTPTVALLLGAGTGGAALALLATDRIVAASHTWVAPLAPEGAAAIRHGGTHDPAVIAWEQRIGAHALAELGFIDHVVSESDPGWVASAAAQLSACLHEVVAGDDRWRRFERFDAWLT